MVEPLFTREHIEGMRPHIQQTVDSLLDALVSGGGDKPIDLVEKFALPVPSYVSPNFNSTACVLRAETLKNRSSTISWECLSRISITLLNALPSAAMEVRQLLKPPMPTSMHSIILSGI
jgi:hypothetical protein